jgi:eukaryotic-like serine/threonine-protein kinase
VDRHDPSYVTSGYVVDGKYRVVRVLGSGGMGFVASATHLELGHQVALKFMKPFAARTPRLVARFMREARAACRLQSEHAARVRDAGTLPDGTPFMVMEYLEGEDLASLIKVSGALSFVEAIDYLVQACEAIAEAHSLGIIHRDIKPANLFLTHLPDGKSCLKVLDFGVSKHLDGEEADRLTRTNTVLGTPHYMAPEQMRSADTADARSDIWALGAVLFHLLAGRAPFESDSLTDLYAQVLRDPPVPLRSARPDAPLELDAVIARCLEKEPAQRFQSVDALAHALRSVRRRLTARAREVVTVSLPGESAPPMSLTPIPMRSGPDLLTMVVLGTVLFVAGGTIALAMIGLPEAQPSARVTAMPPVQVPDAPSAARDVPSSEVPAPSVAPPPKRVAPRRSSSRPLNIYGGRE